MKIVEVIGTPIVYGKQKSSIKRKFRCVTGPRKGRLVADPSTCTAPMNVKKSQQMKATRRRTGTAQSQKQKLTKRYNPTSQNLKKLNRQVKSRRIGKAPKIKLGKK
jgi:hypothetical protein